MSETTTTDRQMTSSTPGIAASVTIGSPDPVDGNHRDPFIDPCPDWCQDLATGHAYDSFDADRVHMSESQCVEHRYGLAERDFRSAGTSIVYPACVRVYLERRNTESESRINIGINDLEGFELTPAEALALSAVLRDLATRAPQ